MVHMGSMDGKHNANSINKIKSALRFHFWKDESLTFTIKVHNGKKLRF